MVLITFASQEGIERMADLTIESLNFHRVSFEVLSQQILHHAANTFLALSVVILLPIALFGLLIEFLQTGPVFALEKIKPRLENINPASGIKNMFSIDNLIELLKCLTKTVLLVIIGWFAISGALDRLMQIPTSDPLLIVSAIKSMSIHLFGWTLAIFLLVMAMDAIYQRFSYAKKMRMSIEDVKKEHKDNEGDPMLNGQRRQLQQEWSQESATTAASSATVMIVNPTHIAIAINYDKVRIPVPIVAAKGQDALARSMRESAHDAKVPVLRNQLLARRLLSDVDEGDVVPRELFDIVAEIIMWADQTREKLDPPSPSERQIGERVQQPIPAPGEDLSVYPLKIDLFPTIKRTS